MRSLRHVHGTHGVKASPVAVEAVRKKNGAMLIHQTNPNSPHCVRVLSRQLEGFFSGMASFHPLKAIQSHRRCASTESLSDRELSRPLAADIAHQIPPFNSLRGFCVRNNDDNVHLIMPVLLARCE